MRQSWTSIQPELLVPLERGPGLALRAQLEDRLRGAIQVGALGPGSQLPSSRVLARDLGLSRGLVVEAYAQLLAEGYLEARPGGTTRVAAAVRQQAAPDERPGPTTRWRYDFRPGVPDLSLFPRSAWLAAMRQALAEIPDATLGYGDPRGLPEVRAALAAYLGRVRGVAAEPGRMVICTGFAQGLRLLCGVLRRAGVTRLALEEPTHPGQRLLVERAGLEPAPVPVDADGLRVDLLDREDVGAVLLTPAHQFPTGVVLAPSRRAALVEWARERDALVIEDDYDAEYRYDRAPVGAVQGLAPTQVVYVGSTSKMLAPALRLGWMVVPSHLVDAVAEEKRDADLGSPGLDQLALARFIVAGHLDRHLRRARLAYRARRDLLVSALADHLPAAQVRGIAAGLHAVVELPPGSDEEAVVAAAARREVRLFGMAGYRADGHLGPPALVLGYAALSEPALAAGVALLGEIVREAPPPSPLPTAVERGRRRVNCSPLHRNGEDVGAADIRAAQRSGEGPPLLP
jgi:GntR family transcriptional regulator/MocR family aminotransferase